MGKLLSRDEILSASDLQTEEVHVPEWGGSVRVRSLTGAERDAYEQTVLDSRQEDSDTIDNIRAHLVAASIVDKNDEQMFSAKDVKALGSKSARALERVFSVATRLSGITDDELEELEGNSDSGLSASSTSP